MSGKELFIRFTARAFRKLLSVYVSSYFSFVFLFVLRLNVPVNNFSVMSVINQYFRGVKCLAQGHNTAAVGIEPPTSRSGVRHSTTEPPRSPISLLVLRAGYGI